MYCKYSVLIGNIAGKSVKNGVWLFAGGYKKARYRVDGNVLLFVLVGMRRLERPTPTSRT